MIKVQNFLIIGYGSSGKRYSKIISKLKRKKKIYVFSKQKHNFYKIKDLKEIKQIKFDLVIICNETDKHFKTLKIVDKYLNNSKILVEKPLFSKMSKFIPKNNKVFVGYNLRFDPIIEYLKKKLKKEQVSYINLNCLSYLPNWRKNINYKKSYSSDSRRGGGVTNDLSHEIDLANYLVGINKIRFAVKSKVSNLEIKADDFSQFVGETRNGSPIIINLGFFFQIEKRFIFIKTLFKSYIASLDERKIIEKSNKSQTVKYFKSKNNLTYIKMTESILKNSNNKCCSYDQGLKINKIISKYKKL